MSEEDNDPKTDWAKVIIHFVCGFVLGLAGAYGWNADLKVMLIVATVTGLAAGAFLDPFWEVVLKWRNWI